MLLVRLIVTEADAQLAKVPGVLHGSEFNLTVNVPFVPPSVTLRLVEEIVNPFEFYDGMIYQKETKNPKKLG